MRGLPRTAGVGVWTALGLAGSLLIALSAPRAVSGGSTPWWYSLAVPGGSTTAKALVYTGVAVLCLAWLGLGRELRTLTRRQLAGVAVIWMAPLVLGPPVFSHDGYSYLAQGTVLRLGGNPYHSPPQVLAGLGAGHVLSAVSPFWRHVAAPYGPLFLGIMSLIVGVTGSHLAAGIIVLRGVDLLGLGLLAWAVPRLARALGTDPVRALWLALLSPLMMLELIAAAHNDILMAGFLAAGVAVALGGRPALGAALCVLGATIKVPALAGAVFIAAAWVREERTTRQRVRFLLGLTLSSLAVLGAASLVTGLGFSWISTSLFAAPARVRLAITPSTQLGFTTAAVLHALGVGVSSRSLEGVFASVSTAMIGVVGLWLVYKVRVAKLVRYLGLLMLLAAAGGPAAWPWYFSWGIVLLAADSAAQHSRALVGGIVVAVFVIKPNGILALPLPSAPAVLAVYVALGCVLWRSRHGGSGGARGKGEATQLETSPGPEVAGRMATLASLCRLRPTVI